MELLNLTIMFTLFTSRALNPDFIGPNDDVRRINGGIIYDAEITESGEKAILFENGGMDDFILVDEEGIVVHPYCPKTQINIAKSIGVRVFHPNGVEL